MNINKYKARLFIGITAPQSVDLLNGQLKFFVDRNYEVYLLAPESQQVVDFCFSEGAKPIFIDIQRNISILKDIRTLFQLFVILRKYKPDIVNFGTPKISLLGMLAAYLVRTKIRIYTCRGFRFEHESGVFRRFLISIEKFISSLSHKVICISKSVSELGIEERIFTKEKIVHIAKGSSNGVNLDLFQVKNVDLSFKQDFKAKHKLNETITFGFVGRLVDRKGLKELYESFDLYYSINKSSKLLIVGRPYWDQIKDPSLIKKMEEHKGIIMVGLQPPESIPTWLAMMDIFLLPAWWEGFGNVLIQAAAMALPIIATNSTGCKDAVNDGFNGILVEPYDANAFFDAMKRLVDDVNLRQKLADNGVIWAQNFRPEIIWNGQKDLYESLLKLKSSN